MEYRNEHGLIAMLEVDGKPVRSGPMWEAPVDVLRLLIEVKRDLSVRTEERSIHGQFGTGLGDYYLSAETEIKGKLQTVNQSPRDVGRIQCEEDDKGSVWVIAECLGQDRDVAIKAMREHVSQLVSERIAHYKNLQAQVFTRLEAPLDPPASKKPRKLAR